MSYRSIILLVLATLNLVYQQGWVGGGSSPFSPAVSAVTYVYEKDDNPVPNGVQAALNTLNREKNIVASIYDDDTLDGKGEIPEQFKLPMSAAKESGLPSLVVVGGEKVIRVVKDPKTADAVLEAAQ